jgi:hypothetical protein
MQPSPSFSLAVFLTFPQDRFPFSPARFLLYVLSARLRFRFSAPHFLPKKLQKITKSS